MKYLYMKMKRVKKIEKSLHENRTCKGKWISLYENSTCKEKWRNLYITYEFETN